MGRSRCGLHHCTYSRCIQLDVDRSYGEKVNAPFFVCSAVPFPTDLRACRKFTWRFFLRALACMTDLKIPSGGERLESGPCPQ